MYEAKKENEAEAGPTPRCNYGVDWNENFFKVMLGDILLEELEKMEDFIDFSSTKKLQPNVEQTSPSPKRTLINQ